MTTEVTTFLAAAIKTATLKGSFSPREIGRKVGLNPSQSEAVARSLANSGVLTLGFDSAAAFTPEYRKAYLKTHPDAASVKPARRARAAKV